MLGQGDVMGGQDHRLMEAVWKAEEMGLGGGKDVCVGGREQRLRAGGKWTKWVWSWAFDLSGWMEANHLADAK